MRDLSNSLHYAVELLSIIESIGKAEKHSRPVSLREVVQINENMSLNFLEQIARKLRIAEILTVVRGPGGGYILDKSSDQISIGDLLDADILRQTSDKKEIPPFKISKALEAVHAKHLSKFRGTVLTQIDGYGKVKIRRK